MTTPPIRPEDLRPHVKYKFPAGPLAGGVYFWVGLKPHVVFDLDRDLVYETCMDVSGDDWEEKGPMYLHDDTIKRLEDRLPPQHFIDLEQPRATVEKSKKR